MKYIIMAFLLVALIILICGHAGLYVSWVWLFGIKSLAVKKIFGISLGVLSVSFVLATVLVHVAENWFTEKMYIASSVWLGFAWYAVLATVIALLIARFGGLVGHRQVGAWVASFLLAVAACVVAYGIWNARQINITEVTVRIPNLPEAWEGKKAVQLSDVHLGVYHQQGFMRKVADRVKRINPDIVFITGDLFDGAGAKFDHLVDPLDEIPAPMGRYYVNGNHETYTNLTAALQAVESTHTTILRDEFVDVDGMRILGIDYPSAGERKDYAEVFSALDSSLPSIVLYHEPKSEVRELAKQAGASLLLAGHTHQGQVWPFGYITRAVYGEYHQGFHADGSLHTYTSAGVGTWGPPFRIGTISELVVLTFTKG